MAVAGWLVPGAGYWLIGERARALTAGLTIVALFALGILLGGIRAVQVPGYGENGQHLYLWEKNRTKSEIEKGVARTFKVAEHEDPRNYERKYWIATGLSDLLRDVGNKPWSICQVLMGPAGLASAAWSVSASKAVELEDGTWNGPAGVLSHSRVNEIAVLYTAVAGMLNLMVIIDAAARAAQLPAPAADSATSSRSTPTRLAPRPEAA